MIKISNLRIRVTDSRPLIRHAAVRLRLRDSDIVSCQIIKKALDARRKQNISFVYTLAVTVQSHEGKILSRLKDDRDIALFVPQLLDVPVLGNMPLEERPIIVGAGPAGLLAAYTLASYGYRPLLLERGQDVDTRTQDIADFWRTGHFLPSSNVQFGEGGAGTFSDGKLTTRVTDPYMLHVLDLFIASGAPPEIRYVHKPHVGTDRLKTMVRNLRKKIIALGGEVRFRSQVTDVKVVDGHIAGCCVNGGEYIPAAVLLLAIGHSARDTYEMLLARGIAMERKPFAIGVRIEHPQLELDRAQYGSLAGNEALSPADYALIYHDRATGRTAYSFCMCPGGAVVAAASECGRVVTNGMSLYRRDSGVANSALVVNVEPEDCGSGVLSGINFQRHYEELAFVAGGSGYGAPVQTVGDFLRHTSGSRQFLCQPSYRPGVQLADLHSCLPDFVSATLEGALLYFARKVPVFRELAAPLTGVETRTSAPVRILRDADFLAVGCAGLYPVGEGAGYAGGIMSAALDGLHAAHAVMKRYRPC